MATRKRTPTRAKRNNEYDAVVEKIKPVSAMDLTLAALFYGRAGTGKTTVACTFPRPILHLDIREKGTDSVSDLEDVDSIQVEDWDEFEQLYWYLDSGNHKYKTVVIDAVSQLQDFAVEKALAEDNKTGEVVSKRQWGQAAGKLKTWIINYRDLVDSGIHVVFLAHDRAHEGEESEDGEMMPSVGPRVMPSVASVLTASVKLIGNTFIREQHKKEGLKISREYQYCMRVGPHAYYETKIRQPKGSFTPDIIEDPSYDKLVSIMKGTFKPERPAPTRKLRGK